jgi:membrane protein YdbS with pleckstrin-like domain
MYNRESRNPGVDAKFIEAGGLKSWGCFALLISIIVLALLFVLVRLVLLQLIGEPAASWGSLIIVLAVASGVVALWISNRRKQRRAQEQVWQQAIGNENLS